MIPGNSKKELSALLQQIKIRLEDPGLNVHEKKTKIVLLDQGVDFMSGCFLQNGFQYDMRICSAM